MAWECNGRTNLEMVTKLRVHGILTTKSAEAAMIAVDRAHYVEDIKPYSDRPSKFCQWDLSVSAVHMDALALSFLSNQLTDGGKALDVGSGSGYLTACMAFMVGPRGKVVGIDNHPEVIEVSTRNVREDCPHFLEEGRIKFVVKDGRLGYPEDGPYNAIYVGAAADPLPQELVDQLAPGGRLICPVVSRTTKELVQDLMQVDKDSDGVVTMKKLMDVYYRPLGNPCKSHHYIIRRQYGPKPEYLCDKA